MTARICLTYDDGLPVHREVVAPLLTERGLRATFYIPAANTDLLLHPEEWRRVAGMGHELGNHSCFHPCRTRPDWDWKPPYRLEDYTRARIREELLLANRILCLIDGRTERSYGATCSDLTVGENDSFVDVLQDLFPVVRSGSAGEPGTGVLPFVAPVLFMDFKRADEVIAVIDSMPRNDQAWLVLGVHGIGAGTHANFMEAGDHERLIDWIAGEGAWLGSVTVLEAAQVLCQAGGNG